MDQPIISQDEMISAIKESGYLIEQRIESVLRNAGYHVMVNDVYKDKDTQKTREIDTCAFKYYSKENITIEHELLIECHNNKQPIIIFTIESSKKSRFYFDFKNCGLPNYVQIKNYQMPIDKYLNSKDFHHYYKINPGTQYCTFQQPKDHKKKWIALHNNEQHDSFDALIKP